jgi:NAD(P)-dependent dehydrogenase (short-subunit alcohol dehydrogenase family)
MATGAKAAIVTGAASGLGRAMALGLADSGIDVVAVDHNASALAALATATAGRRGSILTHTADLTQPWAFDGTVAAARERFGRIDILINNAGIGQASVRGISERVRSDSGKRPLNSGAASSL